MCTWYMTSAFLLLPVFNPDQCHQAQCDSERENVCSIGVGLACIQGCHFGPVLEEDTSQVSRLGRSFSSESARPLAASITSHVTYLTLSYNLLPSGLSP